MAGFRDSMRGILSPEEIAAYEKEVAEADQPASELTAVALATTGAPVSVSAGPPPNIGDTLTALGPASAAWQTATAGPPSGPAGGDLGGAYPNPTVNPIAHVATTGQTANDHHAQQHALGGADHTDATLAQLNAKISDANLDAAGSARPPTAHAANHQNGGSDEIATAVAAANAIPKAVAGGALAAGWVDDVSHGNRGGGTLHANVVAAGAAGFMSGVDKTKLDSVTLTKEAFFNGPSNNANGDHRGDNIGSNGSGNMEFAVPLDFTSLVSLEAVILPNTANAAANIDLSSEYGALGELGTNHAEVDNTTTYALVLNTLTTIDLSGVFSVIAAGDFCGIGFTNIAVGGNYTLLGIRLRYL